MHEPARPALLLFPRFGGAVGIEAMGEGEAFVRLTEASTNYVALGEADFSALTPMILETPASGGTYLDNAQGTALDEQLWGAAAHIESAPHSPNCSPERTNRRPFDRRPGLGCARPP